MHEGLFWIVDVIISYDLKGKTRKKLQTGKGPLQILALKELIAMKLESGRPQDLEECRGLTPDQILGFLEDFRALHGSTPTASKPISMKVAEDLLNAFKAKSRMTHTPYQAQIKVLMKNWVLS